MSNIDEIAHKVEKLKVDEEFEKALTLLEESLKLNPNSDEIKKLYIDTLFSYGGYLNDEYVMQYDEAVTIFQKIIKIAPKNYRAYYNLGIAYFNLENNKEALIACKEAMKLKPDYKHCLYNIGLIHESQNEPLIALEYYKQALKIDPKFPYASQAKKSIEDQLGADLPVSLPDQPLTSEKIKKLISLLKMSERLEVDMIQQVLGIRKERIIDMIIEWGNEFDFKLDGQYLIINKNTLPDLIRKLGESDVS